MAKAHRQITTNVTFRSMMAVEMWGEDVRLLLYSLPTHTHAQLWIPVYQPFPPALTQPITHCAWLECIQHTAGAVTEWACNNGRESAAKRFISSCTYSCLRCQTKQEKKDQTQERLQNKKKIDSWRWNESRCWERLFKDGNNWWSRRPENGRHIGCVPYWTGGFRLEMYYYAALCSIANISSFYHFCMY